MPQESLKNLKKRIKDAETLRVQRQGLNQGAYEIAMPQRNLYNETSAGDSRMDGVYTSEGMISVDDFVNNVQKSITPLFTRWAKLESGDAVDKDQKHKLDVDLEKTTETFFTHLNNSNFGTASAEAYYDLAVGTMALLLNKGTFDNPLNFQAVPTAHLGLEEGVFGTIGGVFYKNKIAARLIEDTWPDINIPANLAKIIKEKPNHKITLDAVTYFDSKTDQWYYEVLWFHNKESERLLTRTTKYNPWIIVRWTKIAGEVEGRGQLLKALPDLKMLNHGKQMAATTVQMNAFGCYTMEEDGIVDTRSAEIAPGGFLIVKSNGGGGSSPSIAALPRVGDSQNQEFFFQGLESNIKQLLMANKLPDEGGAVRSPTEIIERVKEFQVDYGTAYGRIMYEYVIPLFRTCLMVLEETGHITIPKIAIENPVSGNKEEKKITDNAAFTKIKMLSPVAKAQALDDVQSTVQSVQMTQALDPRLPLVAYKAEKIPEWIANKLGMPKELVRDEKELPGALATFQQLFGEQQPEAQA